MLQSAFLWPLVAMVAVTWLVWVRLYVERIAEMRARRIRPQAIADSRQLATHLQRLNASDNFKNLFEVPVLFYLFALLAMLGQVESRWLLAGAWSYVVLRAAHSAIHCSYNRVMHRFSCYWASCFLLFGLWVGLVVKVLSWPPAAG